VARASKPEDDVPEPETTSITELLATEEPESPTLEEEDAFVEVARASKPEDDVQKERDDETVTEEEKENPTQKKKKNPAWATKEIPSRFSPREKRQLTILCPGLYMCPPSLQLLRRQGLEVTMVEEMIVLTTIVLRTILVW
jgi:hypothetical protein